MNILHHWNDNLDHILKNTKTPVCYRNQTYEGTVQGTAECKRGKTLAVIKVFNPLFDYHSTTQKNQYVSFGHKNIEIYFKLSISNRKWQTNQCVI